MKKKLICTFDHKYKKKIIKITYILFETLKH